VVVAEEDILFYGFGNVFSFEISRNSVFYELKRKQDGWECAELLLGLSFLR
jgi:hypothetical protein